MNKASKCLILWVSLTVLALPPLLQAAPTPYPKPAQSVDQAIKIVTEHFFAKYEKGKGERALWQVTNVQYTNQFDGEKLREWSWIIFVRSIHSFSRSYIFILARDGSVTLLASFV